MTRPYRILTDADKAEAQTLAAEGWAIGHLAARFSTSRHRMDMAIDPEKATARKRKEYLRKRAEMASAVKGLKDAGIHYLGVGSARVNRDGMRLLKLIPKDTRSLSSRLLGEPLPGRSALDQRRAQEKSSGYQQAAVNTEHNAEKPTSPARCVWQFQR